MKIGVKFIPVNWIDDVSELCRKIQEVAGAQRMSPSGQSAIGKFGFIYFMIPDDSDFDSLKKSIETLDEVVELIKFKY